MPYSVLIVEDDYATCSLWTKHLEFNGWMVQSVTTVEAAEVCIAQQLPSLVILDVNLASSTNGWDLLTKIRCSPSTEKLPVFIVSTLDEPRYAAQLGATDFLCKPCSPTVLIERISQVFADYA